MVTSSSSVNKHYPVVLPLHVLNHTAHTAKYSNASGARRRSRAVEFGFRHLVPKISRTVFSTISYQYEMVVWGGLCGWKTVPAGTRWLAEVESWKKLKEVEMSHSRFDFFSREGTFMSRHTAAIGKFLATFFHRVPSKLFSGLLRPIGYEMMQKPIRMTNRLERQKKPRHSS